MLGQFPPDPVWLDVPRPPLFELDLVIVNSSLFQLPLTGVATLTHMPKNYQQGDWREISDFCMQQEN